jgi:hypothetical protein
MAYRTSLEQKRETKNSKWRIIATKQDKRRAFQCPDPTNYSYRIACQKYQTNPCLLNLVHKPTWPMPFFVLKR